MNRIVPTLAAAALLTGCASTPGNTTSATQPQPPAAMSETNTPNFEVFTTKLDDYFVLGHIFKNIDHHKMGDYYGTFERNQPLRNFAAKFSTPENRLVGIVFKGEQGDNFIVGAIVEGVTEAPDGAELMKFPASEFLVTTHGNYFESEDALMKSRYIGKTVGHAHSEHVKIPDGYERCCDKNSYMERWNFNYDAKKFRMEIWFAMKKNVNP